MTHTKKWVEAANKWLITTIVKGDGTHDPAQDWTVEELSAEIANGAARFFVPANGGPEKWETLDCNDEGPIWRTLSTFQNIPCYKLMIKAPCKKPGAIGDPHFITFSGAKYDYHGECDLVLLQNPGYKQGIGLNIHLRTKIEKFYSYIKTAVVQIGGETFEVTGAPENLHWLNGIEGTALPARISRHPIGYRKIDENQHKYNILLGNDGEFIEIAIYKHFVSVSIKIPSDENFQGSLGLMGKYENGDKVARDGVTRIRDPNDFGLEWQVQPSDPKLFRFAEGPQYPEKCSLAAIKVLESRNLRSEGYTISLDQANQACARVASAEFDICVFDVLATNDMGIAGAY